MNDTQPVVLVTGASRGIGAATAVAFARKGWRVAITARTRSEGERLDHQLRRPDGTLLSGSLASTASAVRDAGAAPADGHAPPCAGIEFGTLRPAGHTGALMLCLETRDDRIEAALHFSTRLFARATAERWAGYVRTLLAALPAHDDRSPDTLPMIDAAEQRLIDGFNATPATPAADADRSTWDEAMAAEGLALVDGLVLDRAGPLGRQAAIAAEHARAPSFAATDWTRIIGHYDALLAAEPSATIAMGTCR